MSGKVGVALTILGVFLAQSTEKLSAVQLAAVAAKRTLEQPK
jgi:hypothetical protein